MIFGIEVSRTADTTGRKFYRVAPVIVGSDTEKKRKVTAYLTAVGFIFAFVYFIHNIATNAVVNP